MLLERKSLFQGRKSIFAYTIAVQAVLEFILCQDVDKHLNAKTAKRYLHVNSFRESNERSNHLICMVIATVFMNTYRI